MTNATISKMTSASCLNWVGIRLMILSNCIFLAVAVTIGIFIVFEINVEYTTCALALTYTVMMFNSFTEVVKFFCGVEQRMISVERVKQYFNNPLEDINKEVQDSPKYEKSEIEALLGSVKPPPTFTEVNECAIVFDNVCLTYEENEDKKQLKFALKNFSLSIKKNEKIAFVGRTGSGKTSILNILFRLYDFQYGKIYVNSKDVIMSNLILV